MNNFQARKHIWGQRLRRRGWPRILERLSFYLSEGCASHSPSPQIQEIPEYLITNIAITCRSCLSRLLLYAMIVKPIANAPRKNRSIRVHEVFYGKNPDLPKDSSRQRTYVSTKLLKEEIWCVISTTYLKHPIRDFRLKSALVITV